MNESWQSVDYISAMYKKTFDQSNISDSYVKNWQLRIWSKQYNWLSYEKLTARDLIKGI